MVIQPLAEAVQVCRLANAWPSAVEGPALDAMGSAVAVERLVFVADDMTLE